MPKPNRYYKLIFLMLFAISLTACANNGGQAQVGLLFPDLESERWKKEEAMLARLLNEKATK
jgi:ABC-type xylose transport system substrate-binding protein